MRIKLYKQFEHWYHGGTIWLYSDPHFDDSETYKIDPTWPSAEEQVKRINNGLSKNDTIIFLGDIGDENWIKKIKGYKVLLLGNHDKGVSNYIKKFTVHNSWLPDYETTDLKDAEIEKEYRIYDSRNSNVKIFDNYMFDEVYEGPIFINEKVLLSHEPIKIPFGINIHGHNHGLKDDKFNICADVVSYSKIRLDSLLEGVKVKSIHELCIDRASGRKHDC